jgi:hypothetical protein
MTNPQNSQKLLIPNNDMNIVYDRIKDFERFFDFKVLDDTSLKRIDELNEKMSENNHILHINLQGITKLDELKRKAAIENEDYTKELEYLESIDLPQQKERLSRLFNEKNAIELLILQETKATSLPNQKELAKFVDSQIKSKSVVSSFYYYNMRITEFIQNIKMLVNSSPNSPLKLSKPSDEIRKEILEVLSKHKKNIQKHFQDVAEIQRKIEENNLRIDSLRREVSTNKGLFLQKDILDEVKKEVARRIDALKDKNETLIDCKQRMTCPKELPDNNIVDVIQKGYNINDKDMNIIKTAYCGIYKRNESRMGLDVDFDKLIQIVEIYSIEN